MEFVSKDAYLWSVLPLSGVSGNYKEIGTFTTFPKPLLKSTKLYGIPFNGTYNSNVALRLINFTASSLSGPITKAGNFLYLFSMVAIISVKWKILGVPNGIVPKIGFYTANYFPSSSDSSRYYLIPTNLGIGLFSGTNGCFSTTSFGFFSVIVEGDYPVELEVTYRNPKKTTIPDLLLYRPIPFGKWCDELIMTQMLFTAQDVLFQPEPEYIALSQEQIAYLNQTSLIISPEESPLVTEMLTATIPSAHYSNLLVNRPTGFPGSSIYSMRTDSLPIGVRSYPGWSHFFGITLQVLPGKNVVPMVKFTLLCKAGDASKNNTTVTYQNVIGSFNIPTLNPEVLKIRNNPITFQFPSFVLTKDAFNEIKQDYVISLPANCHDFGMEINVGQATVESNVNIGLIIKRDKILEDVIMFEVLDMEISYTVL